MADIAQAMRYKIDVKNGLVKQPMSGMLMRGDKKANRIIAELVDGDKTVSLDGVTVTGKFFRGGDGIEIPLDGTASGNEATVLLDEHCYAVDGYFEASVKLTTGGATRTILTITGQVVSDGEGGILDIENVVPSVADILAQYQRMQEVTDQTNAAMQKANEASERANTAAGDAEEKAILADTAAQGASGWANATMTATALETGSAPTVNVMTESDGHKVITIGIPRGNTGATPQISVQVATGAAGSEASVSVSGTAENPVIHLTIPRGNTGSIENLTINGKPVESGTITLTASDVGARPDTWMPSASDVGARPNTWMPSASDVGALPSGGTAENARKLGGKSLADIMLMMYPVGAIYMSTVRTSPASLFGGTWAQLTDRFLLGASSAYAAGSTGGEKTHTLTTSEMPAHAGHLYGSAGNLTGKGNATGKWLKEIYDGGTSNPYGWDYGDNEYYPASRSLGGGDAHNNMPPYLAVYMWKRVS